MQVAIPDHLLLTIIMVTHKLNNLSIFPIGASATFQGRNKSHQPQTNILNRNKDGSRS